MTALEREIERLEGSERINKEQAVFYKTLFKIQAEYRKKLEEESLFQVPKSLSNKIKKGLPIVCFSKIKINDACLEAIFKDIYQLFGDFNSQKIEGLDIKELIEKVILDEKEYLERLSDKLKIDKDLLFFICINIASPIFETVARKLKTRIDEKLWFRSYCPVCGSKPLLARLKKEDGKRVLQCAICNTEWQFLRIKCIWCGTEDSKDLRFFWVDESCRVDVCDKCKGYIKTFDERKLSEDMEIIPQLKDIATTYLDILAEKEGYVRIN
ncbi:MAG: formate dehydrogenase accessory protein FdhE [bacterium]|nr:formate dehydrogenase accessory protein FdhE [bacterium]